jgi:hypothetical protein
MEKNTNSLAIKFGITGGLIFALLAFACWAGGVDLFANFLMIYTWVPVILVLVLIGAFRRRKQLGGYMSFKEALVFAFLAYVIYEVFYALVTIILFRVIDPNLQQKVFSHTKETMQRILENIGAPQSKIDDTLDEVEKSSSETYTIKQIVLGFGTSLIYDFIKSIIIAAVTQKRKPEFAETKNSIS